MVAGKRCEPVTGDSRCLKSASYGLRVALPHSEFCGQHAAAAGRSGLYTLQRRPLQRRECNDCRQYTIVRLWGSASVAERMCSTTMMLRTIPSARNTLVKYCSVIYIWRAHAMQTGPGLWHGNEGLRTTNRDVKRGGPVLYEQWSNT